MHQHLNYRGPKKNKKTKIKRNGMIKFLKKYFQIVENFMNMENETGNKVQEVQRVPYRINPGRNILSRIVIKLTKIKHKESILKAARENQHVKYKGNPIYLMIFRQKLCRPERDGRIYLKY